MRKFLFPLESSDGIERDERGIECDGIDHAYLRACQAIPDVASEILRARKNPFACSFLIENEAGQLLLTMPFTELIRSGSRA